MKTLWEHLENKKNKKTTSHLLQKRKSLGPLWVMHLPHWLSKKIIPSIVCHHFLFRLMAWTYNWGAYLVAISLVNLNPNFTSMYGRLL